MTIFELLKDDSIVPTRVSTTDGGEYASSCPACGGIDRFRFWPGKERWWCRQCGKRGDSIQYLRDFRNMSYREALAYLGESRPKAVIPINSKNLSCAGEFIRIPSVAWQEKALNFIDYCNAELLKNPQLLTKLSDERGLTMESIEKYRIGWCPERFLCNPKTWDIDDDSKLVVPVGIVIPIFFNSNINLIKIRTKYIDNKYCIVKGSGNAPLIINPGRDCLMLLESELDAFLLTQIPGNDISIIAIGSCRHKPQIEIDRIIRESRILLCSLDSDEAGERSSMFWHDKYSGQYKRWRPVNGKDPTEMWKNGENIIDWAISGITKNIEQAERK